MDPPIVTGGVLVMVTIAAVDGVGHTTVLKRSNQYRIKEYISLLKSTIELSSVPTQLTALIDTL